METHTEIGHCSLEEVLSQYETTAAGVRARIKEPSLLDPSGVEVLSVYFVAVKPTLEAIKALKADYRNTLLRKADRAVYTRRAAAVNKERKINENELNTEIIQAVFVPKPRCVLSPSRCSHFEPDPSFLPTDSDCDRSFPRGS
jgi:hypothetical protein